ncbi:MAG: DNA alkylation repair protein [Eubacterium sp.]|nr:DNA alkylation repair protein [Eubacterium sp.]
MITKDIEKELFKLQDKEYRDFHKKLMPTVDEKTIIGVRTPASRKLAKQMAKREDIEIFLNDLPHKYFDMNQLHAFIVSGIKDYDRAVEEVEKFLPYVDNWATCDQLSPKIFKTNLKDLYKHIREWIASDLTYTKRFGIGMLMEHYLDDAFELKYPRLVARVRSDEYYVNMMIAWYFATALAKQWDDIIPFIEGKKLDSWTHNKAIQKSIESYRITKEQKNYLRTLKIQKGK